MEFAEFKSYINKLKENSDRLDKIAEVLDCEIFMDLTGPLFDMGVDLLESHFNDEDGWIGYWIFELNFGKDYKPGMVTFDYEDVPLKTIEDLYKVVS